VAAATLNHAPSEHSGLRQVCSEVCGDRSAAAGAPPNLISAGALSYAELGKLRIARMTVSLRHTRE
jgi:hypothetical protein